MNTTAMDEILSEADAEGFVDFGDLARNVLNMQCQYASYYVRADSNGPDLSGGLRIQGNPYDYHSLRIHKDDAATFVARVQSYRIEEGMI